MILTTSLPPVDILTALAEVSRTYGGNVRAALDLKGTRRRDGRHVYRLKISAVDGTARGSRTGWRGQRGPWACWHVFRDVLAAIYFLDVGATVRTGAIAGEYRSAGAFLLYFRQASPGTEPLCDCDPAADIWPDGLYVHRLRGKGVRKS